MQGQRRRVKRWASVPAADEEYWTVELVGGVRIRPRLLPNPVLSGHPKTECAFGHRWIKGWILTPVRVSLDITAQGSAEQSVEQVSSSSSLSGCLSALPWRGGGSRGGQGIAHFLHHFTLPAASLVTAITKGCSALGDTDLSQPAKPESRRLLTSPRGLGVTVRSLPGVAWDSPPGNSIFSTRSGSTYFFLLKTVIIFWGYFLPSWALDFSHFHFACCSL